MIQSIGFDQHQIIKDIITLHIPDGSIECDVTYSKGNFYKKGIIPPLYKFDKYPVNAEVIESDSACLPLEDGIISSLMYDPPFLVAGGKNSKMQNRFSSYKNCREMYESYSLSIKEFRRVIKPKGVLIVKCQDIISGGKQYMSHIHIHNEAISNGFIAKDLFILLAKHRIKGHNHQVQKHARKFHSYFMVFQNK